MSAIRENLRTLSPLWRWVLGIFVFLLVILIVAQIFARIFLDDIVGDYLKKNVRKSTNNAFRLNYGDLDINLLGGSVELDSVHLKPDSSVYNQQNDSLKKPSMSGEALVDALEVRGVNLWAYLFRNTLSIDLVLINRPVLSVDGSRNMNGKSSQTFSSVDSSLYALISPLFSAFQLDAFEIRNGSFRLRENDSKEGIASLQDLSLHLRNIHVDSASAQSGRLFVTDDIEFDATEYAMNLSKGFYTIRFEEVRFSSSDQKIQADSLQLIPRLPRYDFSAKKGEQIDRTDLLIGNIMFREVDFSRAIESGHFYAKALNVDSTRLNVFHDMNKPFPPGRSPELPQLAFRKLPYHIKIDTIKVNDTNIEYTEHREGAPQPGSVSFENLQASIAGLSNFREDLASGRTVTMETQTEVMGKGLFNTYFTFYLHDPQGFHTIDGNLGSMAFSDFSPALENLAFARMDQGVINSMEFSMKLDIKEANGSVILNYENLNIELLQSETLEQGTSQQIKSFIANTFVVKENNSDPPLRKGKIKFERNKQKSVFNFWWKALSTGLENSIGL